MVDCIESSGQIEKGQDRHITTIKSTQNVVIVCFFVFLQESSQCCDMDDEQTGKGRADHGGSSRQRAAIKLFSQ